MMRVIESCGKQTEFGLDCPVCQMDADWFWIWEGSDIIGCNHCLRSEESHEEICPVCGLISNEAYMDSDGTVYGCDNCLKPQSVLDWFINHIN